MIRLEDMISISKNSMRILVSAIAKQAALTTIIQIKTTQHTTIVCFATTAVITAKLMEQMSVLIVLILQ